MEIANKIDFAYTYLEAKKAMNAMHDCMVEKQYDEALEHAISAITELKMTYNAILHEKEGLRG